MYRAANTILRFTNDGRILMSFKPIGFFTTSKYEQLRVQEADRRRPSDSEGSEDEEEDSRIGGDSGKIEIQGGAFALLADQSDA